MTGYQSKKAASLDEEGFYTVHPKDEDDDTQVYQRPWVELAPEDRLCAKYMLDAPEGIEAVIDYITAKLKELNA
jgi:hypothetical protein